MQRVFPQARRILIKSALELLRKTALDIHGGAIVQITTLRALQPNILNSIGFLGHSICPVGSRTIGPLRPKSLLEDLGYHTGTHGPPALTHGKP